MGRQHNRDIWKTKTNQLSIIFEIVMSPLLPFPLFHHLYDSSGVDELLNDGFKIVFIEIEFTVIFKCK